MTTRRDSPRPRSNVIWSLDDGKVVVDLDVPARPFGSVPPAASLDDVPSRPPMAGDIETDEGDAVTDVPTEDDAPPV